MALVVSVVIVAFYLKKKLRVSKSLLSDKGKAGISFKHEEIYITTALEKRTFDGR